MNTVVEARAGSVDTRSPGAPRSFPKPPLKARTVNIVLSSCKKTCSLTCMDCKAMIDVKPGDRITACPACTSSQIAVNLTFTNLCTASAMPTPREKSHDAIAALTAFWAECAGPIGITKCLADQWQAIQSGARPARLPVLLHQRKYLNDLQSAVLSQYASRQGEPQEEMEFLTTAAQMQLLKKPQVSALLAGRSERWTRGQGAASVVLFALEQKIMNEVQVQSVLEALRQQERGVLCKLQQLGKTSVSAAKAADVLGRVVAEHKGLCIATAAGITTTALLLVIL